MKILRTLPRNLNKVIKLLTKFWGVRANIYAPIKSNNLQHGFKDNDIEFEEEPLFSDIRVLIPSYFRLNNNNNSTMDLFDDDDDSLYLNFKLEVPLYSKVSVKEKNNKVRDYIINEIVLIEDNERLLYKKYLLVPFLGFDKFDEENLSNTYGIVDTVDNLTNETEVSEDKIIIDTDGSSKLNSKYTYEEM